MSYPPNAENQTFIPPPPGVTPDFAHPESRAIDLYITAGICLPLILLFAALRFYAKLRILKFGAWDDLTCALGIAASLAYLSLSVAAVGGGVLGLHGWDVPLEQFTKERFLLSLVPDFLYGPVIWLVKLSIFVLLLEIFSRLRWLRLLAIYGAIVTGLFYFGTLVALAVLCSPSSGSTTQLDYIEAFRSPRCASSSGLVLAQGAMNMASDLYLIILPLPAVWSLNLTRKRKLAVSAVFATSLAACVASMVGFKFRVDVLHSPDDTWTVIPVWVSYFAEITAGTLVSCMPTIAAVFKKFSPALTRRFTTDTNRLDGPYTVRSSRHRRIGSDTNLQPLSRHNNGSSNKSEPQLFDHPDAENSWRRDVEALQFNGFPASSHPATTKAGSSPNMTRRGNLEL